MRVSTWSLYWRLVAGFAAAIAAVLVVGMVAIGQVNTVAGLTDKLFRHPFTVSNATLEVKTLVISIHRDMRSLALNLPADGLSQADAEIERKDKRIEQLLGQIRERYLGSPRDLDALEFNLRHWHAFRDESIAHLRAGRAEIFVQRTRGEGNELALKAEEEAERIISFARNKAAEFNAAARVEQDKALLHIGVLIAATVALALGVAALVTRSIGGQIERLSTAVADNAAGRYDVDVPFRGDANEIGRIADAVQVLKESAERLAARHWVKSHVAQLSAEFQSCSEPAQLSELALTRLASVLGAAHGALFLFEPRSSRLERVATYALSDPLAPTTLTLGQGLAGQCARERRAIVLAPVPAALLQIGTTLGAAQAAVLHALPLVGNRRLIGAMELAFFTDADEQRKELLDELLPQLAMSIDNLAHTRQTQRLLEESQQKSEELAASQEELQAQQEELAQRHRELQERNAQLQVSEEELRSQQEELRAVNEEVREKSRLLERALGDLTERAEEVERASRYKSEFLANMSHELRTPLNSLLILARDLAENAEGNLLPDQVESARVILEGGQSLLNLINDILDLSKVEAGKLELRKEAVAIDQLAAHVAQTFRHMAEDKGLEFRLDLAAGVPARILSDGARIEQILTNLIGNAIKFTEQGRVTLRVGLSTAEKAPAACRKGSSGRCLVFDVEDTGIGIPADKIEFIFGAFDQIDGRPTRKYGGSGLGLAISRKLAELLGGCIAVVSEAGRGSCFSVFLPADEVPVSASAADSVAARRSPGLRDDRDGLADGETCILVVEDDLAFAAILGALVRKKGYRLLHAADGAEGLALARRYLPRGIILDEMLPSMAGHEIVAALRADETTQRIPVHFISALNVVEGMGEHGVLGCLTKPVSRRQIEQVLDRLERTGLKQNCRLLVVAAGGEAAEIANHFAPRMREVSVADNVEEGLAKLADGRVDLLILDPALPAEDGADILERAIKLPPTVVYTSADLLPGQLMRLREFTDSIVVKSEHSLERLSEEVAGFLRAVAEQEESQPLPVADAIPGERFDGRTLLVVDDDMRNLFALSKVLRGRGFRVLMAKNGEKALEQAASEGGIDAVLMDIMMPEMDGYEAIRRLRQMPGYEATPIIAITALAMPGDRDKCLAAGADDYLTKPVDPDSLFATLGRLLES